MSDDTTGLEVVTLAALKDAVNDALAAARARNQIAMNTQYKANKSDRKVVTLNGTKLATATLTIPADTCTVASSGELDYLEWVRDNHPGEIELVPAKVRVREAFRKNHLKTLRIVREEIKDPETGDTVRVDLKAVDPETGEVVPGVVVLPAGEPTSFRLSFADGGRERIAEAWQRGELADLIHFAPPAIEPGEDEP
jgi:hypothetical protein